MALCVLLLGIHCIAPCVVCPVAAGIKGPCDRHVCQQQTEDFVSSYLEINKNKNRSTVVKTAKINTSELTQFSS